MSAVPDADGSSPRSSRLSRWVADHDVAPPPAQWLFGGPNEQAAELADLRRRLAEAERRAVEAEAALPHLLALGQRTVNGLLSDARARGRQIIDEARSQAVLEVEQERLALQQEARELDALRMAIAAEAMGLEQIRAELEAGVAAVQLAATERHALPAPEAAPITGAPDGPELPPPPNPADLAEAGMTTSASSGDDPTSRFADAWAAGEDDMMAEAFDRFFAAEIASDPMRDSVIAEGHRADRG